jgi:hypothetical protein
VKIKDVKPSLMEDLEDNEKASKTFINKFVFIDDIVHELHFNTKGKNVRNPKMVLKCKYFRGERGFSGT